MNNTFCEMVRLRRVLCTLSAPHTTEHKLLPSLCITESVSTGTLSFTVSFTVKNVPVMERPYKCIDKYILPMDEPPRVCT